MPSCFCSSGRVLLYLRLAFNLQSSCLNNHSSTGITGICYHAQLSGVAKDPMLLEQPTQIHSDLSNGLKRRASSRGFNFPVDIRILAGHPSAALSAAPHSSPRRGSALCLSSPLYHFGSSLLPSFQLSSRSPSTSTYPLPFLKAAVRSERGGAPDSGGWGEPQAAIPQ